VHQDAERQLFVLRQLATGAGSVRSRQAAAAALRGLAVRLDACLFGPLRRTVGDRPLVVVPTADLSALAWSTLPSCRGRAVTVAPSATSWFGAAARGAAGDAHAAVVAGPGLPGADREAATIAASYPNAALLAGSEARVSAVLSALDGAHLAHLAAHGVPRADNPLFTSLRLADGPLTVYDLERLERAPLRVVLSACDMGRPDMRPGEEMLGLAAALLAVGSQSLVASVVGVPDEAAVPVMVALHRRLARGQEMGAALADVQLHSATVDSDPATLAAAAGFVCLGAA
jgi:CHAT domain-containing protein